MIYPLGWPRCVWCESPVLDGHLTCGRAACSESAAREYRRQFPRCNLCGAEVPVGSCICERCQRQYLSDCCGGREQ